MGKFSPTMCIAIRAENESFEMFKNLATVTGAKQVFDESGITAFTMSDGSLIEIYRDFSSYPNYLFANNNIVISFKVKNLEDAVSHAAATGFKVLTGIVCVCTNFRYAHLALPDGTVIGLFQEG